MGNVTSMLYNDQAGIRRRKDVDMKSNDDVYRLWTKVIHKDVNAGERFDFF